MISFVTPFLSGEKWLELHLQSIRNFHPKDEIIISAPDNSAKTIATQYGAKYYDNNRDYHQAIEFMFETALNDVILLMDCDTVIFRNLDYLAEKLKNYDLIGIEERIKYQDRDSWFRFAPGNTDLTFFMFSRKNLSNKNPAWPKFPDFSADPQRQTNELHYGIFKVLKKHYYLLPYGTKKYGLGNLIKDGDKKILWHQWFGSWEKRGSFISEKDRPDKPYKNMDELKAAEHRFFRDYPAVDLANPKPLY